MPHFEEKAMQFRRSLILYDTAATILVYLAAYGARVFFIGSPEDVDFYSHIALLPMIIALLLFFLSYSRAYSYPWSTTFFPYAWSVFRGVSISIGVLFTILYFAKIQYVSRVVILVFTVLEFIVLTAIRGAVIWNHKKSVLSRENLVKVLIIGSGFRAKLLSRKLKKHTEWSVDIIGYLDPDPTRVGSMVLGLPVLGTVADITSVFKNNVVDEVILAIPRTMIGDAEAIAAACDEEGIKLRLMANVFDLHVARWSLSELEDIPLLTMEPVALDENKLFIKRIVDLSCTLAVMPLVLPLMGLIALAIKLDSPGPVFFRQDRVGFKKRIFQMIKFRSMYEGSEKKLEAIEHLNEAEGPIFKIANDPRVTRVGKILRRTSMDELPQLFHVISGKMSLVGPRPMSTRDVSLFDRGQQRKRFSVKPGLTCLWQISGRSTLPFTKWLELDLTYIETWSLYLDMKILFKTVFVVLKGNGAY